MWGWMRGSWMAAGGWTPSAASLRGVVSVDVSTPEGALGSIGGHERPPVTLSRALKHGGRRVRIPSGVLEPYPLRRLISSLIAGTISWRSPMTAYVALVTIGASASELMARMFFADAQPAQCWMAPLMPHGM